MRFWMRTLVVLCGWFALSATDSMPLSFDQVAWGQKPEVPKNAKNDPKKNDAKADPKKNQPAAQTADGLKPAGAYEIAKAEGKLEAMQMQSGIIKIGTPDKKEVFVQTGPATVIAYTAEAESSWLSPGVLIRFSANFDASGKPTGPLKSLEVFTPVVRRHLSPEQMREQTPGFYQEGKEPPAGAKNLFGANNKGAATREKKELAKKEPAKKDAANDDTAKKEPASRKTKKDSKDSAVAGGGQAYRVVGQLTNIQDNHIMVMAGQPMQLELAPDCKVQVSANELQTVMSLAIKGDEVTVSGLRNPAEPQLVMAEQITMKAAKKLTAPEMVSNKRGRPTRGNAKDSDDKETDKDKDKSKKPADKKPK